VGDAVADEIASEAALITTFYGPRDEEPTRLLHRHLYRSLARMSEAATIPDHWKDPSGTVFLDRFEPPGRAAHDATVVQLALNARREAGAAEAWEEVRQQLERILPDATALDGNWGYTLVYQAELKQDVDADLALSKLLSPIRRLHSSDALQPLAQTDVLSGQVWLLGIPISDHLGAATVYAALCPPDQANALLGLLYGPGAALVMPDLIAHKSYYQMRQYRGGDLESRYEESVRRLRQTTDELLKDIGQRQATSDNFDELAREYRRLTPVASRLKELHIALAKQSHNYNRLQVQIEHGDLIELHREQLETAVLELKLKVEELQHALETADKTVSLAQVQADKVQQSKTHRIEFVLAVTAAALAVPHWIEGDTIGRVLEHSSISILYKVHDNVFVQLVIQVALVLAFALLATLLLNPPRERRER
jgi:hypothetical protein